jgi:hypothetical protein
MREGIFKALIDLIKDKNGSFSLREVVVALLVLMVMGSWIGEQFFGKHIPEYMFYSFITLIGAGCFGYSIEKKQNNQ